VAPNVMENQGRHPINRPVAGNEDIVDTEAKDATTILKRLHLPMQFQPASAPGKIAAPAEITSVISEITQVRILHQRYKVIKKGF
jgi:hypothetical protein